MKKNKAPLTQALSERELDWLQNYLNTLSQTNADFMTLEAIDGLFCALIINPVMAKPADWMNTIFGKKQAFNSDEELENVMTLLIRYWNNLSVLIENYPNIDPDKICFPHLIEHEHDSSLKLAEKWAAGFYIGMDYCRTEWNKFISDKENMSLVIPFSLLKDGHNPNKENEILTNESREALLALIPSTLHKLFHYWIEKTSTEQKESKTKIGRNDPCPCGSGKKYKKCCDA